MPTAPVTGPTPFAFDAIVLAGGRGSRLGGRVKSNLVLNGSTLGELSVAAVADARSIAWVGLHAPLRERVVVTRETVPYSGPAAAVSAGLDALPAPASPWTIVIACDVPLIVEAVAALRAADPTGSDGLIAVDAEGRRQPLLALYDSAALRRAAEMLAARSGLGGASLRSLTAELALREVTIDDAFTRDIDTPSDAALHGVVIPDVDEETNA